jgi:UDP:flavonoid glycosyltransferase YjiC (YdhE family)
VARVLFVVPPLAGHINPTIGVGVALIERGHDVAWAGLPGVVDRAVPPGGGFHPVGTSPGIEWYLGRERRGQVRGAAALKFLWEEFLIPVARYMSEDLPEVIERFRPDVVVVDQQAPAGAIAAKRAGVPWVTSATTSAELVDPLRDLPRVDEWVRDQLRQLVREVGSDLPGDDGAIDGDLRFSEVLTLAFTTEALSGPVTVPGPVHFVGPSIADRSEDPLEDGLVDPALPNVLVSLGTVNAEMGGRFFAEVIDALADEAVHVVMVAPAAVVTVPETVTNVVVREHVPQLELLAHLDLVICHGGHNTVCEALAAGVPLVVAPIRDDQPFIADQVVRAGAGVRVKFGRVRSAELREIVRRVLSDDSYRRAAAAVGATFEAAGGADAAAEAIEDVAGQRPHQLAAEGIR